MRNQSGHSICNRSQVYFYSADNTNNRNFFIFPIAVPKLTRFPPPRVEAIEGNAVIMQCQAQGHPRPVISWRTKGAPVNLDSRVTVEPRGDLRFTRVHSRDGGVYRCLATNKAGSVVSTSRLVIKGQIFLLNPES